MFSNENMLEPLAGTDRPYIIVVVLIVVVHVAVVGRHAPGVPTQTTALLAHAFNAVSGHQEQILAVPLLVFLYR